MSNKDYYKAFRIRKTISQMAADRGYNILDADTKGVFDYIRGAEFGPFLEYYRGNKTSPELFLEGKFEMTTQEGKPVLMEFVEGKLSVDEFAEKITEGTYFSQNFFSNEFSSLVVASVKEINKTERIRLYTFDNLMFNITEHVLVPKHRQMSKEEAERFFSDVPKSKIPFISFDDPVSKYYDFEIGKLIEIVQKQDYIPGIKSTKSYRIVVE